MNETFLIIDRFTKVAFGTSGVRALVADSCSEIIFAYVYAFIQRMQTVHSVRDGAVVKASRGALKVPLIVTIA